MPERRLEPKNEARDAAARDGLRARLLLVDDQPANLTALRAILEPLGHVLVTAASGKAALKHLLGEDFALILLDVQMPGMDGFETATLIKQREKSRHIPIIFVTALQADETFLNQAYATGAADYLAKPYSPVVLKSKVSVFVNLYLQREQIRQQNEALRQGQVREIELRQAVREQEQEQRYLKELARREAEKATLAQEVEEMARRQRVFLREILNSLTEGRLQLCDSESDLPTPLPAFADPMPLAVPTLRNLRLQLAALAEKVNWPLERMQDFETAISEAAMNAVVHGKNAVGHIRVDGETRKIQVWVRDEGGGISEDRLHRATLERGYTTAGTLGHGFWMMLKTADRVYLLTGKNGTTVVLEQEPLPPLPVWMQALISDDLRGKGLAPSAVVAAPGRRKTAAVAASRGSPSRPSR